MQKLYPFRRTLLQTLAATTRWKKCLNEKSKDYCVDKKCLQDEEILAGEIFLVPYDKWVKSFKKWDTVKNVWEKIAEDLDFVESSNFTGWSTEAVVCNCIPTAES